MFNAEFLAKIGLSQLSDDQKVSLLGQINKEYEVRVGRRLTEGMSKDEALGLEKLILTDHYGALKWIDKNRPTYQKIVIEEARKIKRELIANRDRILGANE